jgi:hypothetical protein
MENNTGFEVGHHEIIDITDKLYVSMFTEVTYYRTDSVGYIHREDTPQEVWMNVALFHKDFDDSLQQRDFNEESDYYRYIAELQNKAKNEKTVIADTYSLKGKIIEI